LGAIVLSWFDLQRKGSGDWQLRIPQCKDFAPVIDAAFPQFDHIGWKPVEFGRCYTYFRDLSDGQATRLREVLAQLQKVMVVRRSDHLAKYFGQELDGSFALAFTFATPGVRTEIGQMEYLAKYRSDVNALNSLGELLVAVVQALPQLRRTTLVAAVPSSRGDAPEAIPVQLAARVAGETGKESLRLGRKAGTPIKNLPLAKKIPALEGAFKPNRDVTGQRILLVDDLCQSGASLWVAARRLKAEGASRVYGLVCVKSWGDTDNQ